MYAIVLGIVQRKEETKLSTLYAVFASLFLFGAALSIGLVLIVDREKLPTDLKIAIIFALVSISCGLGLVILRLDEILRRLPM